MAKRARARSEAVFDSMGASGRVKGLSAVDSVICGMTLDVNAARSSFGSGVVDGVGVLLSPIFEHGSDKFEDFRSI